VRIAVVGGGVVGLATAASLVRRGVEVVCFERSTVMGERSAGSSRIFRLAHVDADLVRLAHRARAGFARWGAGIVDPVGCVVSGGDAAQRASAMAAVGVAHELRDTADGLGLPVSGPVAAPVLLDPAGGVVDVDAVRTRLIELAGHAVVHAEVERVDGAAVRVGGATPAFDAVVLAAGAGTAALAAEVGIDLPSALQHHARFTFPLDGGPRPAWIDAPAAGLRTYQHRSGPGRWSVGGTVDAAAVAWAVGPAEATRGVARGGAAIRAGAVEPWCPRSSRPCTAPTRPTRATASRSPAAARCWRCGGRT
jgi:sarcosine oxidase